MTDISAIVTAHREGLLAGVTARSALEAIAHATATGISTEIIVVLDRPDDLTRDVLANCLDADIRIVETDFGDPGLARNAGIEAAGGTCATFLDGDDLWSENWLTAAFALSTARPEAVIHSQCNIVFGGERNVWWHVDSEGDLFDPDYLRWTNYWDAMSFARTATYRDTPFRANDLKNGFGHEDWHWNVQTVAKGIPHKPAPGTLHFKRRRSDSQMANVAKHDASIWPD
ncbi:glycosyltransferase family A protein [Fluviibacterium sp. DFM31]|uniref:Glycosyltransferase family A protein n=1 Tax=Meridianimarinicoccus marinus TaxID=3231483 RepID=A0ABV3L9M8_9RHOB